jgi:hypothetical protein
MIAGSLIGAVENFLLDFSYVHVMIGFSSNAAARVGGHFLMAQIPQRTG